MTTAAKWSGKEAPALHEASHMSARTFAAHPGVAVTSATNWEQRGEHSMTSLSGQIMTVERHIGVDRAFAMLGPEVEAALTPSGAVRITASWPVGAGARPIDVEQPWG